MTFQRSPGRYQTPPIPGRLITTKGQGEGKRCYLVIRGNHKSKGWALRIWRDGFRWNNRYRSYFKVDYDGVEMHDEEALWLAEQLEIKTEGDVKVECYVGEPPEEAARLGSRR